MRVNVSRALVLECLRVGARICIHEGVASCPWVSIRARKLGVGGDERGGGVLTA